MNTKLPGISETLNTASTASTQSRNRIGDNAAGTVTVTGAAPNDDRVSMSETAQQMRSLHDQLAKQPIVDVARVTSVRHNIMQGTLRMDPERVADKLLNLERALRG